MDTQKMVAATQYHRLAVGLVYDPSAEPSERWIATIGLDIITAGSTAEDALDNALTREALGPDCEPGPASELDGLADPLPFTEEPLPYDDWAILDN
jgi:hypothetical protein